MIRKHIQSEISKIRFEKCRYSLEAYILTYLKDAFPMPLQPFHRKIIRSLEQAALGSTRTTICAPRSYGKTTLEMAFILWCMMYGHKKFILVLSGTDKLARRILDNIRKEIQSNRLILEDCPGMTEKPAFWKREVAAVSNGAQLLVASIESQLRGIKSGNIRPDLIIMDDVETAKSARTQKGRAKVYEILQRDIFPLKGVQTSHVIVGTVLHRDSFIAQVLDKKVWPDAQGERYSAIISFASEGGMWDQWVAYYRFIGKYKGLEGPAAAKQYFEDNKDAMLAGVELLWGERDSYYDLMVLRETIGAYAFDAEYQNRPRALSDYNVEEDEIVKWDKDNVSEIMLKETIGARLVCIGSLDAACRFTENADFSAIISIFYDPVNKVVYVVDAFAGRWQLNRLIEHVFEFHKRRNYRTFFFEGNGFQSWFAETRDPRLNGIPIKPLTNSDAKDNRLIRLLSAIQRGVVRVSGRHRDLIDQILNFPATDGHDDLIDALATAVDQAFKMNTAESVMKFIKDVKKSQSQPPKNVVIDPINALLGKAAGGDFSDGRINKNFA